MKDFEIEQPDEMNDLTDVVRQLGFRDDSAAGRIDETSKAHSLQKAQA